MSSIDLLFVYLVAMFFYGLVEGIWQAGLYIVAIGDVYQFVIIDGQRVEVPHNSKRTEMVFKRLISYIPNKYNNRNRFGIILEILINIFSFPRLVMYYIVTLIYGVYHLGYKIYEMGYDYDKEE